MLIWLVHDSKKGVIWLNIMHCNYKINVRAHIAFNLLLILVVLGVNFVVLNNYIFKLFYLLLHFG
jgi:hypothetical protein